ncbi:acetylxylan esterase [Streptomyces sp. NPDC051218]|uniref:poly(ethylene terephthalate) hydrolase family protein n=1 Tax=Streptomyces sp. NPDC051218 TaxID=3365645 RepID=UPI00379E5FB1
MPKKQRLWRSATVPATSRLWRSATVPATSRVRRSATVLATSLALSAALTGQGVAQPPTGPATAARTADSCPSVGGRWADDGPFAVTKERAGLGHTILRPTELGSRGCAKHPVIIWGNGSFVTPVVYDGLLKHLASHGFIVVAANTTQSGSGTAMLNGLDVLKKADADPRSPYYGKVDLDKVGASGHSQGGGGAINAGADPRVDVTVPVEPGPQGRISDLKGPMFILGGEHDPVVIPELLVIPRYQSASHVPAVYGELAGASHVTPAGDGGGFRGPVTAWFRYFLMGDQEARIEFFDVCTACTSPVWSDFRRNAKAVGHED